MAGGSDGPRPAVTKVLIGIDGSDLALGAARRALELLDGDRASVTLVRVVRPVAPVVMGSTAPGTELAADPGLAEESTGALERDAANDVAAAAETLGVNADTRVVRGDPGPQLCAIADDEHFDVVVVGSHGSGVLKRVLLGSVSHHVMHHAPCPVLVVREPDGVA